MRRRMLIGNATPAKRTLQDFPKRQVIIVERRKHFRFDPPPDLSFAFKKKLSDGANHEASLVVGKFRVDGKRQGLPRSSL
jgi:hypothetical protein